ncbi:MAG: hypothetical protein ACI9E1_001412 [Cryomorphaceae bacterium]|jgi:hypothetical protein
MKTTKSILAIAALTTGLALNLTAEPAKAPIVKEKPEKVLHKITVEKLEVEILNTPRFTFNGTRIAKQPENKEWLEIEAKLNIETKSKLDFLPSLEATFYVVTRGKEGFVRSEKTITFKNVNIEHGEAWVCAYVDPDTLRVITQEKRPKVTDITGVAVTIDTANLYKGKDRQFLPYAEEIFDRTVVTRRKDAKNRKARWWTNVAKSDQKILALEETPFSAIFSDRYPRARMKMKFAMK